MIPKIILSILVYSLSAQANECENFTKIHEVYECVKVHPQYQASLHLVQEAMQKEQAAKQWQNPELQTQFLNGNSLGNEQYQYQIALLQRLSLGGKRNAEIKVAEAESQSLKATAEKDLGETFIQYVLMLYKKRYLEVELGELNDATFTFQKLITQYSSRRRLSNEQEVSLMVFRLTHADFMVRLARLKSELDRVGEFLSLFPFYNKDKTGRGLSDLGDFPDIRKIELRFEPNLKIAEAQKQIADSQLTFAKATSFGDFYVGPLVQVNFNGPYKTSLFGVALNFSLPLWNRNGLGINAAQEKVKASDYLYSIQQKTSSIEVGHTLHTYQTFVEALAKLPSLSELKRKRNQLEASFYRGLIPSSLIVETHRQLLESMISRNFLELDTLESLLRIYQYENRLEKISI